MMTPTISGSELKEFVSRWRVVIGAIVAVATVAAAVGGFVARGIASEAVQKADKAQEAAAANARTLELVAQTQLTLGERVAETKGTIEGVLATLKLAPAELALLRSLPHRPKLLASDSSKVECNQSWLTSTPKLDTIMWYVVDANCQVSAKLVHPQAKP